MSSAGVAMWTAISNPLLLIGHVMRRSMDLNEADLNPGIAVQCEYVVERHPSPSGSSTQQQQQEESVDLTKLVVLENGHLIEFAGHDAVDAPAAAAAAGVSRCACHRAATCTASFSLDDLHRNQGVHVPPRSFSLDVVEPLMQPCTRSPSESSFNYESEERDTTLYFEYRSLDSLASTPTQGHVDTPTLDWFPDPPTPVIPVQVDQILEANHSTEAHHSIETNHSTEFQHSIDLVQEFQQVSEVTSDPQPKTRHRKKRSRKRRLLEKPEECGLETNNQSACSSQSTPNMIQRKRRMVDSEKLSILPIFQQLIVQKHQHEEVAANQRMASCPNLSIKCDVVEYF